MHIKITRTALAEALNSVQTAATTKATLPILQNVKIEVAEGKAKFTCTDLDVTLVATADCEVLEPGATTLPVKQFSAAVGKVIDGTIDISVSDGDKAKMSAGSTTFKFNGTAIREFPEVSHVEMEGIRVPCKSICEMMRKTSFAASQDDTRRTFQGVLLDFSTAGNVVSVATDGRRLAMLQCEASVPEPFQRQFIIPKKAVDIIAKRLPKEGDCFVKYVGTLLQFASGSIELVTKLLDETYPDYHRVVPKGNDIKVTVDRAELAGAIDRISVMALDADNNSMTLTFEPGKIVLDAKAAEYGSSRDEVACNYSGDKITMVFNPIYFRAPLNVIDEETVDILLAGEGKPVIIRKGDLEDYTYVVMPLRTGA